MTRRTTVRTTAAGAALATGVVLGLTACGPGAGPTVTREVDVDDVRSVALATSGDLTVRRGDTPSLTITAGERTQDRLVSEVRDGVLVLDSRGSFGIGSFGSVRYDLVVSELEDVVLSGSGDVEGADITGDDVRLRIEGSGSVDLTGLDAVRVRLVVEGSGDVSLTGRSAAIAVGIEGSGGVDAEDLRTEQADVSISGSGSADLQVTRRLAVSISGSGSVSYTGDPEVLSEIDGSGDVTQDD
jgi:hypothetical protein